MSSSIPQNKEDNLISIDELIFRAKKLGIDFGKGNPRERLRYLTKLGLLPHAKRKSFNGRPPNGAYPEYVIEILKEIDERIKAGKSIQEIKKEKERRGLVEAPYTYIISPTIEVPQPKIEIPQIEKEVVVLPKPFGKIARILKIVFLVLILGGIIFFLNSRVVKEDFYSYLLASFNWVKKLVQAPPAPIEEIPEKEEIFLPPSPEPYLTINAETDINAPLNVKETITAPALTFTKGEFKGRLTLTDLTADRTYTFPNLSGTVCLTTGNCVGIGGEVLSPRGGVPNRLAKFIASNEIGVSSINDFYLGGVAITIDSAGEVGIGIENPLYPLHVKGRIQATGDICTNLRGGKCLSELTPPSPPIFFGISGSGSTNYLPIWTGATTLGNSIVSQIASDKVQVLGTIKVEGFELPTGAQSGFVLTSDADGIASWQPSPTVFTSGDIILRGAIKIFRFPIPAQTTSTQAFVRVSEYFSTSTWQNNFPSPYSGTTRKYAFLIKFADDIGVNSSSTWRVYRQNAATTTQTFSFAGQALSSLEEGYPHLSNLYQLPDNDWQLDVKVPQNTTIRIFEILLLAYDQIS